MNHSRQFSRYATKLTRLFAICSGIILLSGAEAKADLATSDSSSTSVNLIWTAPGDDGTNGVAAQYDIRYSLSIINESNWSSVSQVSGEPSPQSAGSSESFTVANLEPATTYYFAIKSADEANNWSNLSNVVSKTTANEQVPPADIANLAASNPTITGATLSWIAPGDDGGVGTAVTYDIRYSTSNITEASWSSATQVANEPSPQPAGSQETFIVGGLQANTTYYFAIKTADEVPNWSNLSNIAGLATQNQQISPADVTDLLAGNPTSSSLNLLWTAPGADGNLGTASQYDIRYSSSNITDTNWGDATQIHNEPTPLPAGTQQSITINSLSSETTYHFAIKTADESSNWSGLSNIASGLTLPAQDLTAPGAVLDLLIAQINGGSVTLTWTAPGDDDYIGTAAVYDIRYSDSTITYSSWSTCVTVNNEPAPQPAGSPESFTINGLELGATYYFAINTYDEVPNYSPMSNIVSGTTENEQISPESIDNLVISNATMNSLTLTWTAPGDDGDQGTASTYDIRILNNVVTESNWNQAVQINNEPSPQSAGTQETFTISGLVSEITYYIAIKTADEVPNWSAISNCVSATTPDQTPPAAIGDLSAVTGDDIGQVNINWIAPGDDGSIGIASSYVVKVSTDMITDANWNSAISISDPPAPLGSGSPQTFAIGNLNPGQVYYIAMKSVDNFDNISAISNVDSAEAKPFVSNNIDDLAGLPKVFDLSQNYPNPFNPATNIEFSLPQASNVTLAIYDSNGRRVTILVKDYYPAGIHKIQWDGRESNGRSIAAGVYFYRIQADSFSDTRKMVYLN